MSRIPTSAADDVKEAFRELWSVLDRQRTKAPSDRDLSGHRIVNAGEAIDPTDYVTLGQVRRLLQQSLAATAGDVTARNLVVQAVARFVANQIFLPGYTDGTAHHAILFVDENGLVNEDEDHLSFNQAANKLELGFATRIKWFNSAHLGSPNPGYLSCGDAADTGFVGVILGPTQTAGFPMFRVNGTKVRVMLGDESATTDIEAATFQPTARQTYTPTNVTTLRTGDFSTLSAADVRSTLGTLIKDLQAAGLLG